MDMVNIVNNAHIPAPVTLTAPINPDNVVQGSWGGLIFFVLLALGVSFLCSILEAVLLSALQSHIGNLVQQGKRAGLLMQQHKQDLERPISAILTLNTIAHTVGAAGAGAQAAALFGNQFLGVISAILTLLILVLSEIIPKTLGAIYWKQLTSFSAYTIQFLVIALAPVVWVFEKLTGLLRSGEPETTVTRADLEVLAKISAQEGAILEQERHILGNLLHLNRVKVETIMTPRIVVTALSQDLTIQEALDKHSPIHYSRIPIYAKNIDDIVAYVLRYQILRCGAKDSKHLTLKEMSIPIHSVPQSVTVAQVLNDFVARREHIFLVIDEYGGTAGIVTLEDAIETLLGLEIIDELDVVEDLRRLAEERHHRRRNISDGA
jgi:CBS domain containing-hemolysin-like protein